MDGSKGWFNQNHVRLLQDSDLIDLLCLDLAASLCSYKTINKISLRLLEANNSKTLTILLTNLVNLLSCLASFL